MIEAHGVGWQVGGARILEDISISVGAGELLGIIGPNGAGKSSLVNILSGVRRPTRGRVVLDGRDVSRLGATARARRGLARSFQTSALFDGLSAGENVRLAIQASRPGGLSLVRPAARAAAPGQVEALLERVRMPERAAVPAGGLSHGDRRKLELAMALASEPTVLLLDEPMAGVSAEDVDGLTTTSPISAPTTTAAAIATASRVPTDRLAGRPRMVSHPAYAPATMNAPWAKLSTPISP